MSPAASQICSHTNMQPAAVVQWCSKQKQMLHVSENHVTLPPVPFHHRGGRAGAPSLPHGLLRAKTKGAAGQPKKPGGSCHSVCRQAQGGGSLLNSSSPRGLQKPSSSREGAASHTFLGTKNSQGSAERSWTSSLQLASCSLDIWGWRKLRQP